MCEQEKYDLFRNYNCLDYRFTTNWIYALWDLVLCHENKGLEQCY